MANKYLDGVQIVEVVSTNTPTVNIGGTNTVKIDSTTNTIKLLAGVPVYYTTAIPVATPYTMSAADMGSSALTYKTMRVAVLYDQPMKIEFYCGSSSTLTSNKIFQTVTTVANTPQIIDFPICGRYVGVKVTNTGAATTANSTLQYSYFTI